jgi:hypothetical protein
VDEPVPTLVQILNGEKPANNVPVRVEFTPGSRWRASETRGCCPASVSRRSLTPCSCLTSCKIAFESMRFAAFLRSLETRGLQMGPHVLEKLKKGSRSISKSGTLMNAIKMR